MYYSALSAWLATCPKPGLLGLSCGMGGVAGGGDLRSRFVVNQTNLCKDYFGSSYVFGFIYESLTNFQNRLRANE